MQSFGIKIERIDRDLLCIYETNAKWCQSRELVKQGGVLAEGEARQCELQGNLEPSSCGQIKQSGMTAENFDEGLLSRSV